MLKSSRIIAVDMDEVLFPLLRPMLRHTKIKQPESSKYPYNYSVVMDRPREEAQQVLYDYYDSKEFNHVLPIHGTLNVILFLQTHIHLKKSQKLMYVRILELGLL